MRIALVTSVIGLAVSLGCLTTPCQGQTLSERIRAVKRQRANQPTRKVTERVRQLQALRYTRFDVEFDDQPARDVFEFLRIAMGVNLTVRFNDDATGHGIDPEAPITLSMKNVSAGDALDAVLEQCSALEECTWQLRPGFIEAGTKERLSVSAARTLKVYPIDDLLFDLPMYDDSPRLSLDEIYYDRPERYGYSRPGYGGYTLNNRSGGYGGAVGVGVSSGGGGSRDDERAAKAGEIVELIVGAIEPMGWARNGGGWATIHYHDGALIVSAPDFIHRELTGYPRVPPPGKTRPAGRSSEPTPARAPGTPGSAPGSTPGRVGG